MICYRSAEMFASYDGPLQSLRDVESRTWSELWSSSSGFRVLLAYSAVLLLGLHLRLHHRRSASLACQLNPEFHISNGVSGLRPGCSASRSHLVTGGSCACLSCPCLKAESPKPESESGKSKTVGRLSQKLQQIFKRSESTREQTNSDRVKPQYTRQARVPVSVFVVEHTMQTWRKRVQTNLDPQSSQAEPCSTVQRNPVLSGPQRRKRICTSVSISERQKSA